MKCCVRGNHKISDLGPEIDVHLYLAAVFSLWVGWALSSCNCLSVFVVVRNVKRLSKSPFVGIFLQLR